MRHTTTEVLPYNPSYRVFSTSTSKIVAEFETYNEARNFLSRNTPPRCPYTFYNVIRPYGYRLQADVAPRPITVKPQPWHETHSPLIHTPPLENWVITDEFGDEVPVGKDYWRTDEWIKRHNARQTHREISWAKYDEFKKTLWGTKTNPRNIKPDCRTYPDVNYSGESCYTNFARWYYRHPKTQRERRLLDGIINEYGEELVRGVRRNLPTNWDDRQRSLGKTEKSWKHNSKRKKQWIPK